MKSRGARAGCAAAATGADAAAFDRLLAHVSAGFINLPPEQVDAAITDALRRTAKLLDVDRTQLIRSDGGKTHITQDVHGNTYDCVSGPCRKYKP